MKGKELILYILNNNLENKEVFKEFFLTDKEMAVKLGVGKETIKALLKQGQLKGIEVEGKTYILYGGGANEHKKNGDALCGDSI